MRRSGIVAVAGLVAALAVFAATANAATATVPRTITVNGTGIVKSVPDQADFTFGVSTNANSARAALSANATRMTKVIAVLKEQGIAAADIQTAQISLSPNMNQAGTTVVSYTASNSVTARTKNIAKSGGIIDAIVKVGANLVGGPSLTPSDQHLLARKALKAAMADARARAQVIAAAAHVKLGRVRAVSEAGNGPVTDSQVAAKSFSTTPVEAGTVQTEADLTVTFDIA
jgi:uncharacterized protein YggE